MRHLTDDLFEAFDRAGAVDDGPLALAVSGGSDSLALLLIASDWAAARGRALHVLSVDHGLRPEARGEADAVAARAAALGHGREVLVWDAPQPAQAKARAARHRLLALAARRAGARVILTGHTLTDQVETMLMRLAHGSGWRGMAAMPFLSISPAWPEGRGVFIARPLLTQTRDTLRSLLAAKGEPWIDDPSNEDCAYERVRWRRRLDADEALTASAARLVRDLAAVRRAENRLLARWLQDRAEGLADGALRVSLAGASLALLPQALGLLLQIAAGVARPPPGDKLASLAEDITGGGPASPRTCAGAWVVRDGEDLVLARDPGLVSDEVHDDVWDGRFVRDPDAPEAPKLTALTRGTRPAGPGWRALCGDRLADVIRALRAG